MHTAHFSNVKDFKFERIVIAPTFCNAVCDRYIV